MRKSTLMALLLAGLVATTAQADSNGTFGGVVNGTTVTLGGPFDHADGAGDLGNGTHSQVFAETFAANQILIEGEVTGQLDFQGEFFLGEADIIVTDTLGGTVTWQNPAGTVPDTTGPVAFSNTATLVNAGGSGTIGFEFIDTFDDGAGADSVSTNVTATLQEVLPNTDSTGNWTIAPFTTTSGFDVETSVGEFLVEGVFDTYDITIDAAAEDGQLVILTDEDPLGVSGGDTVDTEIGLFDSTGTMVAYSDDEGPGLYSFIDGFDATAGDTFTLVVSGFGSNIAIGGVGTLQLADVTGGTSIGDYSLSVFYAVPEPSSMTLLAIVGLVGFARRRR